MRGGGGCVRERQKSRPSLLLQSPNQMQIAILILASLMYDQRQHNTTPLIDFPPIQLSPIRMCAWLDINLID